MKMRHVTLEDFAKSFGTDIDDIKDKCYDIIANKDFNYSIIRGKEYDDLLLNILKRIEEDNQIIGSIERKAIWNKGWKENLDNFINNSYDERELIPKFIREAQPIRFNIQYISPTNPRFELDFYKVFRNWLFKKYFYDYDIIYEFGCGTGFNLVALANLYPNKILYGLDFVQSSIDLINTIAKHYKFKMNGYLFDMTDPDKNLKLEKNSAIFTIGSIEQLAGKFENFIKYIMNQPVSLCIHVEPIIELYNENNLFDYLAIKFQSKRGYTKGFLPYLIDLESENKIKILKIKRLYFGNMYMEGYNLLVWQKSDNNKMNQ